jgi:hypothetical protein
MFELIYSNPVWDSEMDLKYWQQVKLKQWCIKHICSCNEMSKGVYTSPVWRNRKSSAVAAGGIFSRNERRIQGKWVLNIGVYGLVITMHLPIWWHWHIKHNKELYYHMNFHGFFADWVSSICLPLLQSILSYTSITKSKAVIQPQSDTGVTSTNMGSSERLQQSL